MKLLLTRKKYILKLLCFTFLFLIPLTVVNANGSPFMSCKYGSEDEKIVYELRINKNFSHSGEVLKYNGKSKSNDESIENWGSDQSNNVAFIKNSGICPRQLAFNKDVWGYHINFADTPHQKDTKLFLINDATVNVNNLINHMNLPRTNNTMCTFYDDNNKKYEFPVPDAVWHGLNDIAGGEADFKVGDCNSQGLERIVMLSVPGEPNKQAFTAGIQAPNSCIGYPYTNEISQVNNCKEMTRLPKNEDGTVDEPDPLKNRVTVTKQYESKNTEIGKKFNYEIVYDPGSSWFVGHDISFIKEKDKSYNNNKVYMIYDGTYDNFKEKFLNPMISELKWPSKIYCERVYGYTVFNPTCNVVSGERTTTPKCSDIETTSIVCSVDSKLSSGGAINQVYTFNLAGDVDTEPKFDNNDGDFVDVYTGGPINCSDFKSKEGTNMTQDIFNLIMLIAPILVIVLGGLDFAKASLQSDENAIKKAGINFGKRLIAAVLLFLLPLIISLILEIAFDAGVLSSIPEICID